MELSLYRKYRPQRFSELVGQDHIKDTLASAVRSKRIAHGYLFCGTRGTGKTTTARILAKAINCQNQKTGEPCNRCITCKDFISGKSMDLIEIDAASNRGIDEIREIIEKIKFTPNTAKYKVFVIDEAHMLTREAFNALLKTLEEPPEHAIFILATTEPHKLPPTILSRVQRFDFKRIIPSDIAKRLISVAKKEKIKIDDGAIAAITEAADGSFRDAESLLDQVASYMGKRIKLSDVELILGVSDQKSIIKLIDCLIEKDAKGAITLVNGALIGGHDLAFFTKNTIEYLRKLMLAKTASSDLSEIFTDTKEPERQLEKISAGQILRFMKYFIEAQREIKASSIPQLPLEMAIVDIIGDRIDQPQVVAQSVPKIKPNEVIIKPKSSSKKMLTNLSKKITKATGIDQFVKIWPKMLSSAGKVNHSLSALLRSSVPVAINSDTITLAVHFKFHKDQILEKKRCQKIKESLKKITGKEYKIDCVLASEVDEKIIENIKKKMAIMDRKTEENLMKSVSEVFGI